MGVDLPTLKIMVIGVNSVQGYFELQITGLTVKVDHTDDGTFTVTYGKQVESGLSRVDASHRFGGCVFRALECSGAFDCEGTGNGTVDGSGS